MSPHGVGHGSSARPCTLNRPPSLASERPPARVRSSSSASSNTLVAALSKDSRCSGVNDPNEEKGDRWARCKMSSPQPRPMPDMTC